MGTFWDFWAPFYDLAEKANGQAYGEMLKTVREIVPKGATVLDAAAGTGEISLAVADKAEAVLCTDLSEKMLGVARRKALRRGALNIRFAKRSIYELLEPDNAFDVVVAGQILHLIDEPEKAAAELRRVAKSLVVLPISFTKNLRGRAKLAVELYRLLGFAPKREFSSPEYKAFLPTIGFSDCEHIAIPGNIPMEVAVWRKNGKSYVTP